MGTIYLINSGQTDIYKIGVSKCPPNRIRGLQTGNPYELKLLNFYESEIYEKIETIIHRIFKHKKYIPEDFKHLKGEWFILTQEDVSKFKENCKKIEESINHLKMYSSLDVTKMR